MFAFQLSFSLYSLRPGIAYRTTGFLLITSFAGVLLTSKGSLLGIVFLLRAVSVTRTSSVLRH